MIHPFRFFEHENILEYKEKHAKLWGKLAPLRQILVFFWNIWRESGPGKLALRVRQRIIREVSQRKLADALAPKEEELRAQRETVFPEEHLFSILVPLYNTPTEFLKEMIASVEEQTYPGWELCLADGSNEAHPEVGEYCREKSRADSRILYRKLEENLGISGNTNACIDLATGDYLVLFDHDDLLHPTALYEVMKAVCEEHADFLYSDEMVFRSPNRRKIISTHFKPDFAYDNLLSNNYICHLSVFRKSLLEKAGRFRKEYDGSQDHDIILRLTGCAEKITHIPKILYAWRSHETSTAADIGTKTYAVEAGQKAVRDFLKGKEGIDAKVSSTDACPTMYHVERPVRGNPKVEAVVYAAGEAANGDVLKARADGLRKKTDYGNLTVSTAENGENENLPKRMNEIAKQSDAEYLVFLNSELEMQNADWLREMLMLAQEERIGAVGGKVQFRDGTLRHAGLIIGLGRKKLIGRSHFRAVAENAGYFGQLAIVEDVSAVSAECMMISRKKLAEAGWLDEGYRKALFDADLCLKLGKKGCVNVYTPFAKAKGGNPRKQYMDLGRETGSYREDANRFRSVWAEKLAKPDPFYNPNLTLEYADYRLRLMNRREQRREKP